MALFYIKDGEPFIPEAINPELARLARLIVKTCRLSFKLQLKTTGLSNCLKSGDKAAALDLMQRIFEKNRKLYDEEMALTGVKLGEVDEAFFTDKDDAFWKQQLQILIDFAAISVVIENRMFPLMSGASEKTLGKPIDQVLFFSNQETVLPAPAEATPSDRAE